MQLSVFFINNLVYILWRSVADYITIVVTIAWRIHLFSFRTQKLSFSAPKVLVGWLTGRIGRCHIPFNTALCGVFYLYQRKPRDSRVVQKSLTVDLYFIFWDCRVVYNAAFLLLFYYTFLLLFYAKIPQAKHVAFVFLLYLNCVINRPIRRLLQLDEYASQE